MEYIERKLSSDLEQWLFREERANIVILSGVVGCGKTTLVTHFLNSEIVQRNHQVFTFTLDDITIRDKIASDTSFFISFVNARKASNRKPLCFIDEVQKSEAVFDAIKLAWDAGIDFIVSGSNPEYLETQASKRLQRRSNLFSLGPLSLVEILNGRGLLGAKFSLYEHEQILFSMLDNTISREDLDDYVKQLNIAPLETVNQVVSKYLVTGGLPRAYLAQTIKQSFSYIQATIERGFDPILNDTLDILDIITVELAHSTSCEFSYENFFQRTRTKKRDKINHIIGKLMGHGYLKEKRPYVPDGKSSYFVTYSFIDPGMVAYLTDTREPSKEEVGRAIESYVHARLDNILNMQPRKSHLCYYKPYGIRKDGEKEELRFKSGEIDFVVYFGALSSKKSVALEVKRSIDISASETKLLRDSLSQRVFKRGIVLYGGVPHFSAEDQLIYWPWWLI